MRLKSCATIVLIASSLAGAAAIASADTMVITYRSGKVQRVVMDLPSEEVQGVSYTKDPVPPSEIRKKDTSPKPPATVESAPKEPRPEPKKSGATIRWAEPMDQ